VKQQIQLLFYFKFAFDFVDLSEKSPPFGFQQVVSIDRTILDSRTGHEVTQSELFDDLRRILFRDFSVNGHPVAF
jgi:hypothetical protein